MPLKGNSGLLIKPCYDGLTLVGVQQVAGDGLSVISIKESHRNCKFLPDPCSKQPLLSCTQGIKARNSFWNLHKPDLRKLKGLECATTESVTQLFRAHNVENAGKPTYKKKMLRLLESLVSKKSKTPQQPVVLVQNGAWPENICVLSSVCEEREIKITGIKLQELSSSLEHQQDNIKTEKNHLEQNYVNKPNTDSESTKDTVYISLPSPSNMLAHSSENAFIGTFVQKIFAASKGDSTFPKEKIAYTDTCTNLESNNTTNPLLTSQTEPSSFKLKSRKSLLNISASPYKNCCSEKLTVNDAIESEDIHACSANCNTNNLTSYGEHNVCIGYEALVNNQNEKRVKDETIYINNNERGKSFAVCGSAHHSGQVLSPQSPSSDVVQSIFTEMFKEMQEIEDYISLYISSFCSREEEFENYPAINTMSSEVVSHVFEHVRGTTKLKTDRSEKSSLNTKRNLKNVMSNSIHKSHSDGIQASSESGCLETEENSYTFGEANKSSKIGQCKDENIQTSILQTNNKTSEINYSDLGCSYRQEPSSGYCYWEDIDITSSNICNHHTNISATAITDPFFGYNTALIPVSFFENMWREFIAVVDPHDLYINLVSEQIPPCLPVPEFSPDYGYWEGIHDQKMWEEAQNIVHSIDSFITIGCFPNFKNFSHDSPCSITEITEENLELISNLKEDSIEILQTVTNIKNPKESCKRADPQLFSYPQQWSEHTSNESLYRETEVEENTNSADYHRRRSIFIKSVSEVSLLEGHNHSMTNFEDSTYNGYKVPTCSKNVDKKPHTKTGLDQISEEYIPREIFNHTSPPTDKLETDAIIKVELMEPSADTKFHLSSKSLKLEKLETTTNKINQGRKNKSVESGKSENQLPSNQSTKHKIVKKTKQCVDQVCPLRKQCLHPEVSEDYSGSDIIEHVSSKVSLNKKNSNISTNIALRTFSELELHNKDSNSGSKFMQIPKTSEEISSETTSQMVFSSPKVQLNLTNPLHVNKK